MQDSKLCNGDNELRVKFHSDMTYQSLKAQSEKLRKAEERIKELEGMVGYKRLCNYRQQVPEMCLTCNFYYQDYKGNTRCEIMSDDDDLVYRYSVCDKYKKGLNNG